MEIAMATRRTPVDEYLDSQEKTGASRDEEHLALWQTWKANPTPKTLEPLLQKLQPTFNTAVRNWKATNVHETAFRMKTQGYAIKAMDNYDPARGASLVTHVTNNIKKVLRDNTHWQNAAYIPEDKTKYIGKIDASTDKLRDELNREPTHAEIATDMGSLSARRVKEIQGLRRPDIRGSSFMTDPVGYTGSRDREIISLLKPELSAEEQVVFEYIYGEGGKPKLESTGAIASRIGKSPSYVSRVKNRIAAAYRKYSR
jgi:hypothetical protein